MAIDKDIQIINNIRMLGVEMIGAAKSGHPGIVLGAAPILYALFKKHLTINLNDLQWMNRDRFILSAGHGSALLYAQMLAAGYPSITLDDIKAFRQLGSKTSGHPEPHLLAGVDYGTGPLGQGAATSVGFALAEAHLNKTTRGAIDHRTYCVLGDGCLQEGVTHEAIAVAGRNKLKKLIWLYDSNRVQLDGRVSDTTNINWRALFGACGWTYLEVVNGTDWKAIDAAISLAKKSDGPTIIEVHTTIGYGSPVADSASAHGAPLSAQQIAQTRANLNYTLKPFTLDPLAKSVLATPMKQRGERAVTLFKQREARLKKSAPGAYGCLQDVLAQRFVSDFGNFDALKDVQKEATRNLFGQIYKTYAAANASLLTLNCDLSGSTKVKSTNGTFGFGAYGASNINVGVRELFSACAAAGISAHGGVRGVFSTFMSFADYAKPSLRLAAINSTPVIAIFSHDSITVGEDGPTHQPVEQLTMLRAQPNTVVFRPASTNEVVHAMRYALERQTGPTCIITSRSAFSLVNVGGYTDFCRGFIWVRKLAQAKVVLLATGSEVATAMAVAEQLSEKQIAAAVVSITSLELLRNHHQAFKATLPVDATVVAIEAGTPYMWYEFASIVYGMTEFGVSGKPEAVVKKFGLDADTITQKLVQTLKPKA